MDLGLRRGTRPTRPHFARAIAIASVLALLGVVVSTAAPDRAGAATHARVAAAHGCSVGKGFARATPAARRRSVARLGRTVKRLRKSVARQRRQLRRQPSARHRRALRRAQSKLRRLERRRTCQRRALAARRRRAAGVIGGSATRLAVPPAGTSPATTAAPAPAPVAAAGASSSPAALPASNVRPPALTNPRTVTAAPCAPEGPAGQVPTDIVSRTDLGAGDYIVRLTQPVKCALWIRGGANVVVVGGEVDVSSPSTDCRPPSFDPCDAMAHVGVYLSGQTGTVHLEGLWIHGADIGAGVAIDDVRTKQVNLVNIRLEDLHTYDTATLWADTGTPAGLHPDCVAAFAGPARLQVDGMTCATSYFGFQLSPAGGIPGGVHLRRTNVHDNCWTPNGRDDRCGHVRYMIWYRTVAPAKPWTTAVDDVWLDPGRTAGHRAPSTWGVCDVDGDQVCGHVSPAFRFARRPADFVPAGSVGMGYRPSS